jgi:ParB-like chromosome segregation protein Spo0J
MPANKHENYEIRVIPRVQIKNAEYNPRKITDIARRKLKKNINTVGLIAPIIWNKRTGNIVSGHQRISIMDALQKTDDYNITVSQVDLDEATEKAQNIFMNNAQAQGEFDLGKLDIMLAELKTDATGFDAANEFKELGRKAQSAESATLEALSDRLHEIEKREKKKVKDNSDFFLVVVFRNYEERKAFTEKHDWPDNRYVSAEMLEGLAK